jgi:hypothetical protein
MERSSFKELLKERSKKHPKERLRKRSKAQKKELGQYLRAGVF